MSPIRHIFALLGKDLKECLRNKTILIFLLSPIILSLFFTLSFKASDLRTPQIALVDKGNSQFVQFLKQYEFFRLLPAPDEDQAQSLVQNGKVSAILVIPQDFDAQLHSGSRPALGLMLDESVSLQSSVVGIALMELLRKYCHQEPPASITLTRLNRNASNGAVQLLPMWLLFTLLGGLSLVATSWIEEREKFTAAALNLTPLTPGEFLAAKLLLGVILAMASALIILSLNSGWMGNIPGLLLFLCAGSLLFAALGAGIGMLASGQTASNALSSLLYIVLFMPVAMADSSALMWKISQILPSFYLYEGIRRTMFSALNLAALKGHLVCLTVVILLFLAAEKYFVRFQEKY